MSRALAAALLLALAPCARADEADAWLGPDRAARFASWAADLKDGEVDFPQRYKRLGTTREAELERARRRVMDARTKEDVYYALTSLRNSLHDGHSRLTVPAELEPPRRHWNLPLRLRPARGTDGVRRFLVRNSALPGVRAGMRLETYGGAPPEAGLAAFTEWLPDSSPEAREFEFARWLTARDSRESPPPGPDAVALSFRDEKTGAEVAVSTTFAEPPERDDPRREPLRLPDDADYAGLAPLDAGLNYRVYADSATGTLILRDFSFFYQFDAQELWNKLAAASLSLTPADSYRGGGFRDELEKRDWDRLLAFLTASNPRWKRLLVDVRENDGGGVNLRLAEALARKPFLATTNAWVFTPLARRDPAFFSGLLKMASEKRAALLRAQLAEGRDQSSKFSFNCSTDDCGEDQARREPASPGLRYETYVLAGPDCVSSCDQFVAVFADNGIGTLVGLPGRGASSPARAPKEFKLAGDRTFSITLSSARTFRPNGEELEANPPQPALRIYPGPDYLRTVLDAIAAKPGSR